jgi:hypothetical protein
MLIFFNQYIIEDVHCNIKREWKFRWPIKEFPTMVTNCEMTRTSISELTTPWWGPWILDLGNHRSKWWMFRCHLYRRSTNQVWHTAVYVMICSYFIWHGIKLCHYSTILNSCISLRVGLWEKWQEPSTNLGVNPCCFPLQLVENQSIQSIDPFSQSRHQDFGNLSMFKRHCFVQFQIQTVFSKLKMVI